MLRCGIDGTPSAAEAELRVNGFVRLRGVLDDDRLIDALDAHISEREASAANGAATTEHASGSLLPPALVPEHRSDVLLDLEQPVTTALSAALVGAGLQELLQRCCGPDALLWELSAMRSRPGAQQQPLHPDVRWQRPEPSAIVVWIALCDVTREMGPTMLLAGTHTEVAHECFHRADEYAAAAAVGCQEGDCPMLKRGDALIMDARVLHCGLANTSESERTLFYFTMRRDERRIDSEWTQSSLRASLRDRHSLRSLCAYFAGRWIPQE